MSHSAVLSADWGRWAKVPTVMLLWGRSPWNKADAQQNQPISREGHEGVRAGQGLGVVWRSAAVSFRGMWAGLCIRQAGSRGRGFWLYQLHPAQRALGKEIDPLGRDLPAGTGPRSQ